MKPIHPTLRELVSKPGKYSRYTVTIPSPIGPLRPILLEPAPNGCVRVWHVHNGTGADLYLDLPSDSPANAYQPPF